MTEPVIDIERGQINPEQYAVLMRPLNKTRIAKRSQGGKQLSYLESWDVRAHLTRVFGFGNFDLELLDYNYMGQRDYDSTGTPPKPMTEVIYSARVRLTIRDGQGRQIATYVEGAVGSASGPANMLGEHHDNALKTAESDALKRCAINLGTQFGLSLYDNGSTMDVIKNTLVKPEGAQATGPAPTAEQAAQLAASVGSVGSVQSSESATPSQNEQAGDAGINNAEEAAAAR